jgi:hypothetical protein
LSETGSDMVTPELALVDPELAKAQRQIPDRKAAMSSTPPSNGTFFIDPAQPAPSPGNPDLSAVPAPVAAPVAAAAEAVAPAPAPTPAPAAQPALAALPPDDGSTPMRDVPLGTLIFRAGLLAEEQLEDALQEGMRTGKRLGEVLLERGWLHERDLGRLLAGQKGLPFVEIHAADAEPLALQKLPEEKARMQIALPLRYEEGQLVVAVADPSNELVLENLRRSIGAEPRLVVAPQGDLLRAIGEAYAGTAAPQAAAPQPETTLHQEHELQQVPTPRQEPILRQEPTLAQEPVIAPEPVVAQETIPQPEPTPTVQPEPILMPEPEPTLTPEPALQPEPAATAPVVTPLATVLPPAETRDAQPTEAPLQQPVVIEPVEQPPTLEPMTPPAPTAEEAPAPLLVQPAPQPEPTVLPEAITLPEPPPVEPVPAPLEPLTPVLPLQMPVVVEPEPMPEAPPLLTPPAAEQPLQSPPVPLGEVVEPAPPEAPVEATDVNQGPDTTPASVHVVFLRLNDGETLEVGTFHTAAEASARAQEVVKQIATAEGEASWPFFADRYLRPDTIVSVDLLEELADKWMGSAVRTRWANQG